MSGKRILLINGSPRKNGTSYSFARTFKLLAENGGNEADIISAVDYFEGRETIEELRKLLAEKDIIAISAPLYADTLPYHDIWLLEKLCCNCGNELRDKTFFAVGQSGFPDITRLEPFIDACRFFAEDAGMKWMGGLAYGGGAMINGAKIEELGKKGAKIIASFSSALENVLKGEMIDKHSQELITVKIPKLLYRPLVAYLNSNAKKLAKESGNLDFKRKVYLE